MNGPPKSPRRLRDVVAVGMLAILALAGPAARPAAAQGGAGSETAISIPSESPEPGQANPGNQPTIPTRNLWSILVDGGPLMIPIAACSLILLAFVFERFISLRRGRVIPKPFVTRLLQQIEDGELERDEALELCEQNGSPVAEVFAGAVRKWGRPAVEVEQAVIDSGERVTNGLRRYLRVINGVATISPLLGLLGTVWGMIEAFNAIATADALGRPELLAKGISQALLTTAAGLTVAIPALIFYMFFVSRVDRLIIEIDALGVQLVGAISAEDLQQRKLRGPKARRSREPAV